MDSVLGSGKRRVAAVLAAIAVIVGVAGVAFGTAEAGSTVTPQSGPSGRQVHGTYKGQAKKLQTMLFEVDVNGQTSFMFCIDIATYIQFGVPYDESSWSESAVPNLNKVARVLSQTNATTTKDPVEIAAAQAAIWHFSDGFDLDVANPNNDPAVTARYNALVSDADANPVSNEPAGTLDITPSTATVTQGKPVFFDVTTTSATPLSIELSDAAVSAHPATGDSCDVATTITSVQGNQRICLTSTSSRSNVKMTLRTGSAPLSAGRVFIRPQRQKLIIGKSGAAQASETVNASWTANGRPSVTVTCPKGGVQYGAPTKFSAKANDPDGDVLTYQWMVNGSPVAGQTGADATLTVNAGDKVSVVVTDAAGQQATADANCPGRNKPTVGLVCPDKLQLGAENTFTAIGSDPDGDAITFQWEVNGTLVSGTTGPTLKIVVNAGDVVRVTAADSTGMLSDTVDASCIPPKENRPPVVSITCPTELVYGTPATFTAVASDPDGDPLTYIWSVNGEVVADQSGPTATLTIREGDKVQVVANDGELSSDTAEAKCTGNPANKPPTVKLSCPKDLVYGTPTEFTANGSDPDDDPLTYSWTVNGSPIAGQNAATVTLTVKAGDKVAVTASDGTLTSAAAEVKCTGTEPNLPPTVTLDCPAGLVWGTPATFTAKGNDPEGGALTYQWRVNDKKLDVTSATIELTLAKGDVVTVSVKDSKELSSGKVTATCTGNSRPQVKLECPKSVFYGEPMTFTASGTDADGDALTYVWKVNGRTVAGQTGPSATFTIVKGDRVNVAVVDAKDAASDSVTVQCTGTSRPTVTITCPSKLVWGEPFDFIANGVDPDGDTKLGYSWYINGVPVAGQSGPKLTATLGPDDVLTVTVTDSAGAVSASASADCDGNHRPKVALVCPEKLVYGTPTAFTATGSDTDGDKLTYVWKIDDDVVKGADASTAELTVEKGQRVTVTATDGTATSTAATSTCTGTSTPKVTTTCPKPLVWGEAAVFTAVGTDEDGDTLTYAWAVNGTAVAGQTGATATLSLKKGDTVTVTATDPTGLVSETATFDCIGKERPRITLVCPADFVFGTPAKFSATVEHAKAEDLVFTWALNGKVIDGATTASVVATLRANDVLAATATDADGLGAVTVGATCVGTNPPAPPTPTPPTAVPPVPSMPQVLAGDVYRAAAQTTRSSSPLAVTGGEALAMAGIALAALAAGLLLVGVSRRKKTVPTPDA